MSTHEGIHTQLNNTALRESPDRANGGGDVGFELTVSDDKLEAFILPKDDGYFEPNLYYCKGCGICSHECPKDVITMIEEA